MPIDLDGAVHEIAAVLKGTDVLIACTFPTAVKQQIALADAAKIAGVTRFVPSFWATPSPPGVMLARDLVCNSYVEILTRTCNSLGIERGSPQSY